jgi:hypothetical protein
MESGTVEISMPEQQHLRSNASMTHDGPADHVEQNRRVWDDEAAAWHGPLARDHWAQVEPWWCTPAPA